MGLRERFEIVVSPCVSLVAVPGVKKLRSDFSGEFPVGLLGLDCEWSKQAHRQHEEQGSRFFHYVFFCAFFVAKESGIIAGLSFLTHPTHEICRLPGKAAGFITPSSVLQLLSCTNLSFRATTGQPESVVSDFVPR